MTLISPRKLACIGFPALAGILFYWPGLTAWFQKDDFAWLGMLDLARDHSLSQALFQPMAQGTIRTLGERVPFIAFRAWFGIDPLPFRILAFATFAAVTIMLNRACARITGSEAAGFWAAILWMFSSGVAILMAWSAPYHELLLSLTILLALYFLVRYAETGRSVYYAAQWTAFLIGFGVLEQNVVYPALALAYVLCFAPQLMRRVVPMFLASAVYTAIHMWAAPMPKTEPYLMHWDLSIFGTLWTYWKIALGPNRLILFHIYPGLGRDLLTVALMAGLFAFLIYELAQQRRQSLFFAAFFLLALSPYLPIRNHIIDYYLTIPRMGLAMWGAWAFVCAWRSNWMARSAGIAWITIALAVTIPVARLTVLSFHDRSIQIRDAVLGTVKAIGNRKDGVVLLRGIDTDLYWSAFHGRPLRLFGIVNVYMAEENRAAIEAGDYPEQAASFFITPDELRKFDAQHRLLALDLSNGAVRDVTSEYHDR